MANPIPSGPSRLVLLVEDEADARTILARRLPALGWRCLVHDSVESALAAPELSTVDAIAADVSFGDGRMSGVELVLQLRSRGVCVPVVLMSGVADAKRLVAALQPGAAVLLEKPFATEVLRSALEYATRNPISVPEVAAGSH
jgi:FixJ family two-component response regulator